MFVVELRAEASDGDATPVLVLHGFPTSSWDFVDAAMLVSKHRRVVLFDFLGFGYSDKPADHGGTTVFSKGYSKADVTRNVAANEPL